MVDWLDVSDTAPRIAYTATSGQTAFTVPFVFFSDADLRVYQNGVLKTITTHYTVAGANDGDGGTVTLVSGATVGDSILITRRLAFERETHFPPSGPFSIPALNIELSRIVAMLQQMDNDRLRAAHLQDGDPTADMEIPLVADRKGKMWAWRSSDGALVPTTHTYEEFDSVLTGALTVNAGFGNVNIIGTNAGLKGLTPIAGAIVYVQGRQSDGDGGQGVFAWKTGDYSAQILVDTYEGVYVKANSVAANLGCWVRQFDGVNYYSKWFGTVTGGPDNSARITSAIATMALPNVNYAPTLRIEPGVKFDRTSITFSKRGFIEYFNDDDTRQNPYTTRATSEYNRFAFNANNDGAVNEFVFNAAYGPSITLNVDKDAPGHDAYLGPNHTSLVQGRIPGTYYTTPGNGSPTEISSKAFLNIEDERFPSWIGILENFGTSTKSVFDGMKMHAYRRRLTLNVDTTAGMTSVVGSKIQGLISGAFGYYVSKTATTIVIDWQYSQFAIGEELYDFATVARPVIQSITVQPAIPGQHMWFGQSNGAWSVGIPPGYAISDNTIGGRLTLAPPFNVGQVSIDTVSRPVLVFCPNIAGAPATGRQIILDSGNRLVVENGTGQSNGNAPIGHVDAVGAYCFFTNAGSGSAPSGSFNVASVVRNSTGLYTITLATAMLNASYNISLSGSNIADNVRVNNQFAGTFSVQNFNSSGGAADLVGTCYATIIGGK